MATRVYMLIGCTAAGKGKVGLELARRMGGELVSVDSMKIYRRMDIGTNKPSAEARRLVPHHLIDIVEPSESYSLGRFVADADRAIADITGRGKAALAVGGTMMYVRGLVWGVFEGPGTDLEFRDALRERATREGVPALHAELAKVDPVSAGRIHPNDFKRIERALEVYHLSGRPISSMQAQWDSPGGRYDCRIVALHRPREEANRRINARVKKMIEAGLVEEVRGLLAEPAGISPQAAQAVGYAPAPRLYGWDVVGHDVSPVFVVLRVFEVLSSPDTTGEVLARPLGFERTCRANLGFYLPLESLPAALSRPSLLRLTTANALRIRDKVIPLFLGKRPGWGFSWYSGPRKSLRWAGLKRGGIYSVSEWSLKGKAVCIQGVSGAFYPGLFEPVSEAGQPLDIEYEQWEKLCNWSDSQ